MEINKRGASIVSYCVFEVGYGLGNHVLATAVAQAIKNNYPDRKLIVISRFPTVFENLHFVYRSYDKDNLQYFYYDFIKDKDTLIFTQDGYYSTDFILKKKHLIESWVKMLGLEYNGEEPSLNLNAYSKQSGHLLWSHGGTRPYMVLNTSGGSNQYVSEPYFWCKDIPQTLAQKIVNRYKDQYHIYQITRDNGYELHGVERLSNLKNLDFLMSLLYHAEKRVLIDSACQHISKALDLPSVVLWNLTHPSLLGYDIHTNLKSSLEDRIISSHLVYHESQLGETIGGVYNEIQKINYPYSEVLDIFDLNDIYNAIDGVKNDPS